MNKFDVFRRLTGTEKDPRSTDEIWREVASQPDFVDSRDCGLVDVVQSGWFLGESGELFKGFAISAADSVLDVGCGAGATTFSFTDHSA